MRPSEPDVCPTTIARLIPWVCGRRPQLLLDHSCDFRGVSRLIRRDDWKHHGAFECHRSHQPSGHVGRWTKGASSHTRRRRSGILEPMLIDVELSFDDGARASRAGQAESEGYDALWAAEVGHDPLMILAGAATTTSSIELGTAILVAFGRSPMITAMQANDVQLLSKGRLLLGLGSQIKPHIEKRYSMTWSHPAARMREYVLALHAIWASCNDGSKLNFRGEFYRHTLMTPFFYPGPNPYGAPRIFLAAVGELMTEVAGEVADGLLVHPFTTERYLREVTLPALQRGLARSGRTLDTFQIALSRLVATGNDAQSLENAMERVRGQIAFYGSTPAYRGVLDLHGWADLQPALNSLSRDAEWEKMGSLISDEVLDSFSIVGEADQVATMVRERFGDVVTRFSLYTPYGLEDAARSQIVAGLKD